MILTSSVLDLDIILPLNPVHTSMVKKRKKKKVALNGRKKNERERKIMEENGIR